MGCQCLQVAASNNSNEYTFADLPSSVDSLVTFAKSGKSILVIGFDYEEIKLIDLDDYSTIKVLQLDSYYIRALHIYHRQSKSYLVGGGHDGIKVWDLDDFSMVHSIENDRAYHITTLHYHDKLVLSYSNREREVIFLNLSYFSERDRFKTNSYDISGNYIDSFEAIRYKGKVCLIYPGGNKTMGIWNIEDKAVMASIDTNHTVSEIKAFMQDDKACLLTLEERYGKVEVRHVRYEEKKDDTNAKNASCYIYFIPILLIHYVRSVQIKALYTLQLLINI